MKHRKEKRNLNKDKDKQQSPEKHQFRENNSTMYFALKKAGIVK
jgi:hypothetical protein